jgi:hypothetical protein
VILFGQAHLLPHWGPFSDSLIFAPGVTWFSRVTAVPEIGMGLCSAPSLCAHDERRR